MSDIQDNGKELFKVEANDLLEEIETSLLELENSPDNSGLLRRIFRALHTIKGSGSMFGLEDISVFTHRIETFFDRVRNGEIPVTRELIDTTLSAADYIRYLLDTSPDNCADNIIREQKIISMIDKLLPQTYTREPGDKSFQNKYFGNDAPEEAGKTAIYRIRFVPPRDSFKKGINPLVLVDELKQLGRCEVVAITDRIPKLEEIDPETCYTSWDIVLMTDRGMNAIKDIFIFVEDDSDLHIDVVSEDIGILSETEYKRLGEILMERSDLNSEDIQGVLKGKKLIGELLVEKGLVSNQKLHSALVEQTVVRDVIQKHHHTEAASSIRVSSDKLDKLVDLVGEMVTVQVRLSRTSSSADNPDLLSISEEIERLTGELRDSAMSIRMLPIGTTFGKFKRLVRDLSRELGKDVRLVTEGAETELDKTMIEKMNDPLVHLIRNSIDHGIESPEIRQSGGKPKTGTVSLSAVHSGAHVLIRIRDDGKGLDAASIYAKALETGIITGDAKLSEKEIFSLVLSPGFSTAKQVTSVSGRGVGLDVVRKAMETLKGSIDIDGKNGTGTTITLTLPLTLAIIEGLLVKVAEENFVIPLSMVEECVELTRKDTEKTHGRHVANIRGRITPYIRLREIFSLPGDPPLIEHIVITENEGTKVGLVVDHIIGEHQTVIKSMNKFYTHVKEISGATILGDGRVALVIDIPKLIHEFERDALDTLNNVNSGKY